MYTGQLDGAFEYPAVGGGADVDSVLSSQELWAQRHHQTEDGPEGKKWAICIHDL